MGSIWLEFVLNTRVLARWRRLLAAVACVVPVFVAWDLYAIARGHWSFDPRSVTGVRLPGHLPVEEIVFFLVIPFAAILTFEAVRSVRPDWLAGDESKAVPSASESAGDQ